MEMMFIKKNCACTYLKCTQCGARYLSLVKQIKTLKEENKKLRIKINGKRQPINYLGTQLKLNL